MTTSAVVERQPLAVRVALIRILFGLIWAVDAWLKWQPGFVADFKSIVAEGAKDQAGYLKPWFDSWIHFVALNPSLFAQLTAALETAIAISLVLGIARRPIYLVGIVYSLLIWATAEGFGGPYGKGSTDLGTAITYAVVFALLYLVDDLAGRSPWAIDSWIERRVGWWDRVARTSRGTA